MLTVGDVKAVDCWRAKFVDSDKLVLEDAALEEASGDTGDIEEDIGEGANGCSMGEWNCAGNP